MSSKSNILEDMRDVMRLRHYSIRTEQTYCGIGSRPPFSPQLLFQDYHVPACYPEYSLLLHCGYNSGAEAFR